MLMGIFNNLFGSSQPTQEDKKQLPWKPLNSIEDLQLIKEQSNGKLQVLFKHSTRCGISRAALNAFNANFNIEDEKVDLYYIDLLNYRAVSDEVGFEFQVIHQSPQVIALKNGKVVYHASHHNIDASALEALT